MYVYATYNNNCYILQQYVKPKEQYEHNITISIRKDISMDTFIWRVCIYVCTYIHYLLSIFRHCIVSIDTNHLYTYPETTLVLLLLIFEIKLRFHLHRYKHIYIYIYKVLQWGWLYIHTYLQVMHKMFPFPKLVQINNKSRNEYENIK